MSGQIPSGLKSVYSEIAKQSIPLVTAQMLVMFTLTADVIMVGRISALHLAALSAAYGLFHMIYFFFFGCLSALNPIIGLHNGKKDLRSVRIFFIQGVWLCLFLSLIGMAIVGSSSLIFALFGLPEEIVSMSLEYLHIIAFGLFPILFQVVYRSFQEGVIRTKPLYWFNSLALFLNIFLNWLLIYGNLGFPRLELAGAAYATVISQWVCTVLEIFYLRGQPEFKEEGLFSRISIDLVKIRKILKIGVPVGASVLVESGMFNLAILFIGGMGKLELAAHQIAFNVAANTFMIPLGISIALSSLISNREGDSGRAVSVLYAKSGITIGIGVMVLLGLVMFLLNAVIPGWYTVNPDTMGKAAILLTLAALFQVSDGTQVITNGILKGYHATGKAMVINTVAYLGIGIPLGYYLGVVREMGAEGFWLSFIIALTLAAFSLNVLLFKNVVRKKITHH